MFTDTHCHIYSEYYENIDEIINKSIFNGVNRFISAGCNIKTNLEVIELSKKYPSYYCAIGIHPEDITDDYINEINNLENLLNNEKVIAIGEIGLDYHFTKENKMEQIDLFEKQLALAEKFNLPVVVHSRDAIQDTYDILKKYNVKGVIHSFSGSVEMAKLFIKLGFCLGINGVITFKNCNLKDLYKDIGLEHVVLETDSPYLAPVPFRGKQNYPGNIKNIKEFLCNYYEISEEELLKITNMNICRIFDI